MTVGPTGDVLVALSTDDEVHRLDQATGASLGTLASRGSSAVRDLGLPNVVTKVKANRLVQKVLYRPFGDAPGLDPSTEAMLRDRFRSDVLRASELTGLPVAQRWGYA